MCTLILLRRPDHPWPLLLAANRDEMVDRPWLIPGRHWQQQPQVVAGKDQLAGGSWLGINDQGVIAGIMNRTGTLGARPDKRSRGELVLKALARNSAAEAAEELAQLPPQAYQAFNLVLADSRQAYWIAHDGDPQRAMVTQALPEGLSMFTSTDRNDLRSPRIAAHLDQFRSAEPPDPEHPAGWEEWSTLLADREFDPADGAESAMNLRIGEFGTLSSSLMALPAVDTARAPVWLFSDGPPHQAPFRPVDLGPG